MVIFITSALWASPGRGGSFRMPWWGNTFVLQGHGSGSFLCVCHLSGGSFWVACFLDALTQGVFVALRSHSSQIHSFCVSLHFWTCLLLGSVETCLEAWVKEPYSFHFTSTFCVVAWMWRACENAMRLSLMTDVFGWLVSKLRRPSHVFADCAH